MTVIDKLKALGYTTIKEDFYTKISEWDSWYRGDVAKFHRYKVKTGPDTIHCRRYSLNMGKKLPEDWANLLMNEKVSITLEGKAEQEFIDQVFLENNFRVKANEMQELAFALGTVAFVPRVVGYDSAAERASGITVEYVTADHIFPLAWANGVITECAFDSVEIIGGKKYLYLQIHKKENGKYVIENRIYPYENDVLSDEIPLSDVRGYENVPPVVNTNSDKRQFIIDRPNIANNYDYLNPMGISVYANAIDVLRGVDIAYDSYVNEFILGKKRIMVKPSAVNHLGGEPAFDSNDVIYYVLPEDVEGGAIITPIDMTMRTEEHNRGIQDQLNLLSSKCGFGENHYRFDSGNLTTATQVISENSTLFRTIKKHEILLESALVELCRVILRLGNVSMGMHLNEDVEISIDFDDSIIEDQAANFSRDMQLLNAGIMNDWEFRMRWMNEDEATAKAALPKMEDMATEGQEEIE